MGGDAAGDTLYFIEDLIGSGHNDRLTGTAFANRLYGERAATSSAAVTATTLWSAAAAATSSTAELASTWPTIPALQAR